VSHQFRQAARYSEGRKAAIDMVVIHFTAAGTLSGTVEWFEKWKSKASAHYVIGRDGSVVQMVREGDTAWHAGESSWMGKSIRNSCNAFSVGIELVNWGNLRLDEGYYRCWPDEWRRMYRPSKFGTPKKVGEWWWAPYPQEQIDACVKLVKEIRTRYEIPSDRVVGHEDISPGRKMDPGPMFDMEKLRELSQPEPDILPPAAYMEDPTEQDYSTKTLDRSGSMGWVERLLEYFRQA
jgi:N-acetylmuramoyl-L-alanine amidase